MNDFKYTVDPTSENVIMLMNGTIGKEVDGAEFQKELLTLDTMGKKSIEIMINSGGGSVLDGFSIASAILKCKTPVITNNVGIAGSIAGVIFMTAKNRVMSDYALMMMHNVSGGNNDKGREELSNSISMILSKNTSLSKDQVKKLMNVETWLNHDEAMKQGFIYDNNDNLVSNQKSVVFTENAYEEIYDYANNIINEITMKKNTKETVGSHEHMFDGTEAVKNEAEVSKDIVDAELTKPETEKEIEDIEKEVEDTEKESKEAVEAELENATDIIGDTVKLEFTNMVNEKDAIIAQLQSEIANLKATEKEKEINNFINEYVELGKISNESKESWFNLCKSDFDTTKEVIKSLNINKEAPKFENRTEINKPPQTFFEMLTFGKNK